MINKIKTFIQKIVTPQMGLAVLSIYYFTLLLDMTTVSYSFAKAATLCKLLRYICYVYFLIMICKKFKSLDLNEYKEKIKNFNKKQYFIAEGPLVKVKSQVISSGFLYIPYRSLLYMRSLMNCFMFP